MKRSELRLENWLLSWHLFRWPVIGLDHALLRVMWLWCRVRLAALLRDRGLCCVCYWSANVKVPQNIHLGNEMIIGVNVSIGAHNGVDIGQRARLSRDVMIDTAGLDFSGRQPLYAHTSRPIVIEEGVWIGAHSVMEAGSVITESVPAGSVVEGARGHELSTTLSNFEDVSR